MHSILMDLCTP